MIKMGERNCIYLENDGIYFYSHWDTKEDLMKIVKSALKRGKQRWDDRAYLNRIIFSELIKNEIMELTGYGIGNDDMGGSVVITINVDNQRINGVAFDTFIEESNDLEDD